jgi:cell wall-associated NlpC family hydrolase
MLIEGIERYMVRSQPPIQAGDVLVFLYDANPQHVAIATSPTTIIHSSMLARKVIETNLDSSMLSSLAAVYRFPEN